VFLHLLCMYSIYNIFSLIIIWLLYICNKNLKLVIVSVLFPNNTKVLKLFNSILLLHYLFGRSDHPKNFHLSLEMSIIVATVIKMVLSLCFVFIWLSTYLTFSRYY
jgi:hypothetical protein